jgi:hypothetical protein
MLYSFTQILFIRPFLVPTKPPLIQRSPELQFKRPFQPVGEGQSFPLHVIHNSSYVLIQKNRF